MRERLAHCWGSLVKSKEKAETREAKRTREREERIFYGETSSKFMEVSRREGGEVKSRRKLFISTHQSFIYYYVDTAQISFLDSPKIALTTTRKVYRDAIRSLATCQKRSCPLLVLLPLPATFTLPPGHLIVVYPQTSPTYNVSRNRYTSKGTPNQVQRPSGNSLAKGKGRRWRRCFRFPRGPKIHRPMDHW